MPVTSPAVAKAGGPGLKRGATREATTASKGRRADEQVEAARRNHDKQQQADEGAEHATERDPPHAQQIERMEFARGNPCVERHGDEDQAARQQIRSQDRGERRQDQREPDADRCLDERGDDGGNEQDDVAQCHCVQPAAPLTTRRAQLCSLGP